MFGFSLPFKFADVRVDIELLFINGLLVPCFCNQKRLGYQMGEVCSPVERAKFCNGIPLLSSPLWPHIAVAFGGDFIRCWMAYFLFIALVISNCIGTDGVVN